MIRVLFVTHYTDLYGANKSLLNLIDGLKHKVSPFVICPSEGALTEELRERKINFTVIKFYPWCYTGKFGFLKIPFRHLFNLFSIIIVNRKVSTFHPQIVYSNSSVIIIGYLIAKFKSLPHIFHVREFGKLDYSIQFDFGAKGLSHVLSSSSAVIAISKSIRRVVLNNVNPNLIHTIYNGIVYQNDFKKKPKFLNKRTITFGVIGIISSGKNQLEAVKAFAIFNRKYPNSRLYIVGECFTKDYMEQLNAEAASLKKNKKIIFTGFLTDTEAFWQRIDVHIICAKNEGMGRVTVESMAKGIPTIGFNGGATPELVRHGFNGLLYEKDHHGLIEQMTKIMEINGLYEILSVNCLEKVEKNFTIESYAKQVLSVMNSVVKDS